MTTQNTATSTPYTTSSGRSATQSGGARTRRRRTASTLAQTGLTLAEHVAPMLGARMVVRMCTTVPRARPGGQASTGSGGAVLYGAVPDGDRRRVDLPGPTRASIVTETWGEGPAVYLMHGFRGHRKSWRRFVGPLTQAGFRAVALDVPGHGDSHPGGDGPRRCSLPEAVTALRAAAEHHGPAHAVVAHSMGALAAAVACLDGLPTSHLVLIAPMPDHRSALRVFAEAAGVGERIQARMPRALEGVLQAPLSQFDAANRAAEEGTLPPALVIHDRGDRRVPFGLGARLAAAWPCARLHPTHGLGHNRILRDEGVIAASVDFLTAASGC
jgi:pimeloyl-ACP methyl ester carboxylesterase